MNDIYIEKRKKFVTDKTMAAAVYDTILDSFLKKTDKTDVQTLAAQRIAIDLLNDAWKELETLAGKNVEKTESPQQIGL